MLECSARIGGAAHLTAAARSRALAAGYRSRPSSMKPNTKKRSPASSGRRRTRALVEPHHSHDRCARRRQARQIRRRARLMKRPARSLATSRPTKQPQPGYWPPSCRCRRSTRHAAARPSLSLTALGTPRVANAPVRTRPRASGQRPAQHRSSGSWRALRASGPSPPIGHDRANGQTAHIASRSRARAAWSAVLMLMPFGRFDGAAGRGAEGLGWLQLGVQAMIRTLCGPQASARAHCSHSRWVSSSVAGWYSILSVRVSRAYCWQQFPSPASE